jgi:hypothetical protein
MSHIYNPYNNDDEFEDEIKKSHLIRTIDEIPEFKSMVFKLMNVYKVGLDNITLRQKNEALKFRIEHLQRMN